MLSKRINNTLSDMAECYRSNRDRIKFEAINGARDAVNRSTKCHACYQCEDAAFAFTWDKQKGKDAEWQLVMLGCDRGLLMPVEGHVGVQIPLAPFFCTFKNDGGGK